MSDENKITEAQRDEALRILRADYWQDVRGIVEDLRGELKRGNVDADQDSIETWLHETIDGTARVIYTHLAIETLLFSDNSEAMEEEHGERGDWSAMAYYALRADVNGMIDVDALVEEFGPKCEKCGTAETMYDGAKLCEECDEKAEAAE